MEIVIGFLVNLLSSIIFEILKPIIPFIKGRHESGIDNIPDKNYSANPFHASNHLPLSVYERRRKRAKQFLLGIILYLFHCLFVFSAVDITVDVIGGKENLLYLDQARFIGHYFPHIPLMNVVDISNRNGIIMFLILVILCYVVGWMLALPFVRIGRYFGRLEPGFRLSALLTACLFTYILLAIHIAWLFTNLNYFSVWINVSIVMGVWFLLGYLASLFSKKRNANRSSN